jgi:pimeloyl-ACP methyl ester carboxylesterase
MAPWARRIRVPVLLIAGKEDWIVPPVRAREIYAAIPGNQKDLVVIPKAVHDTTYTAGPGLYETAVLNFLERYVKGHNSPQN